MRKLLYTLLTAIGLTAIAVAMDHYVFSEEFGLWTYTLGTISGLGLALLGLLISIVRLLFSRKKGAGLALGALLILTGVLTFLMALAIWLAAGRPAPA